MIFYFSKNQTKQFTIFNYVKKIVIFQNTKAESPIEVTKEGIVICFSIEHPKKAPLPIEVTEEGIMICFNDSQEKKWAFSSSIGIMISFNLMQFLKKCIFNFIFILFHFFIYLLAITHLKSVHHYDILEMNKLANIHWNNMKKLQ